jgi:hypothetical protein
MRRFSTLLLWIAALAPPAPGQGAAGSEGQLEPRYMVDMPTAGMLDKGSMALDVDFYQEGGVLLALSAGVLDRLSFGVSYGGAHLIGSSSPVMNELPGVNVKIRIIEESVALPAIAVGFDSQGKDGYIKELDRYTVKSPGLFATASKNYTMLGFFSLHGGINYSFERADNDRDFNLFFGAEKSIGPIVSLVLEYNMGLNDNGGDALGKGKGYLNTALRCSLGNGLTIAVHIKDLIHNGQDTGVANRTVRLEYARAF